MSRRAVAASAPAGLRDYVGQDPRGAALVDRIDWSRTPRHIAVIMDGNGRWASQRHLPRVEGHRAGIAAVREVVETCARAEVEVLTLYAFSVENWKRPQQEIDALMELLKEYLERELPTLLEHSVRFEVIGRTEGLPGDVQKELADAAAATAANRGMRFVIALNYGGRTEIGDAVRRIAEAARAGGIDPETIDEGTVAEYLYTARLPDPDLLIRTSGELRVSNFLLFQIAYAEIWVTETLWPDFRRADLLQAIADFQQRERRYGSVSPDAD